MCFYWEAWLVQCSYFACAFAVLTVGFLGVIWGSLGCYDVFVFKKLISKERGSAPFPSCCGCQTTEINSSICDSVKCQCNHDDGYQLSAA